MTSKVNFVPYVFRRFQSNNHPRFHSDCWLIMLCRSDQLWRSSVITQSIHSAAVLQAVLQANTEPFRNGLVETRNSAVETVEMSNRLKTLLVPVQISNKM